MEALIDAVQGRYDLARRWYALKARLLGLDRLAYYDRMAPVSDSDDRIPYGEAEEIVLDCYRTFSPELGATAEEFFTGGYIDGPPRPGKRGGAFCSYTVPSAHPYVMLNYTSRPHDVLTMAHELGHGVHASLARPQGIFHFTTPLTLAETASIFGENIVLERLLERAPGAAERLDLLAGALDGAVAAVFRQIAMNRFEDAIHTDRRESGELSVERFGELWLATQADLLGDSVELDDDYGLWWSYIWHFVDAPGYVYAYAYGHLLALSVYRRYEEEGEGFVASYLDLLRAGGSRPPEELGRDRGRGPRRPRLLELGARADRAPARRGRGGGRPRRLAGAVELELIAERIALPGGEVELMRPPDAEALISEESFEHEEFLPYWAELWSSAVALAHDVSLRSLRGKPTLELGCGLGLPSIAAALRRRARARHRLVARRGARHRGERGAQRRGRRDARVLVGGAGRDRRARRRGRSCSPRDVLYERRNVEQLLDLLPRLVDETRPRAARRPRPRAGGALPGDGAPSAAGRCEASRARAHGACSSTASGELPAS